MGYTGGILAVGERTRITVLDFRSAFDARTGVPVAMNTSFNGPGEPIVETPQEAIDLLTSSEIDAIYIDGRKLVRSSEGDS